MATVRQAVRIILIDPADRVLLMHFSNPSSGDRFWITVGGGIDAGESPEDAIRREVLEEVGLASFELGPAVWTRREVFEWAGELIDQSETFFLARVESFEPYAHSHTAIERAGVIDMRWWSVAELEATDEIIYPRTFVTHYRELLHSGPPPTPIDVGP